MNIPEFLKHLPNDGRGYPVPFNVLIDQSGRAHFKVNKTEVTIFCMQNKLCTICGKPLRRDQWLIGGQLSAFHPRGAFNDPPTHKACGEFALMHCPYMSRRNFKYTGEVDTAKIDQPEITGFYNPTQTLDRLSFFCFVKVSNIAVHFQPPTYFLKPAKPYLEIEYWLHGKRITHDEVTQILKENKEHNYTPKK